MLKSIVEYMVILKVDSDKIILDLVKESSFCFCINTLQIVIKGTRGWAYKIQDIFLKPLFLAEITLY